MSISLVFWRTALRMLQFQRKKPFSSSTWSKIPLEKIELKLLLHFSGWYTCILETLYIFTKVKLSLILVFLFGISVAVQCVNSKSKWLKLLKFICISRYCEQQLPTKRSQPGLLFWGHQENLHFWRHDKQYQTNLHKYITVQHTEFFNAIFLIGA